MKKKNIRSLTKTLNLMEIEAERKCINLFFEESHFPDQFLNMFWKLF